jgi:hypothetical protein
MNNREWRIKQVERGVARGLQDPRDLESVLAHGYVTKPIDWVRQLSIDAAKEIDSNYKPRKRANAKHRTAGQVSATANTE